jgi:hypothetical protein
MTGSNRKEQNMPVGEFDTEDTLEDPYPVAGWSKAGTAQINYPPCKWPPVKAFEVCMVETFGEFPTPYWKTLSRKGYQR